MKWCRRASYLGRFTLWNNSRRRASHLDRFTLWNNGRRATQLGRFNLWHYGRLAAHPRRPRMLATQLSRFTLWHNGRRASQLVGKFTLRHNGCWAKQPDLMHAPYSHAFSNEKYEGLIQSKISLRVWTFSKLLKDERFGRFIKHRSIVDLQQTLKYVSFTKIQHSFKKWTL